MCHLLDEGDDTGQNEEEKNSCATAHPGAYIGEEEQL